MGGRKRPPAVRAPDAAGAPFVIVTGLSGAGKSHAIRALEDLGYFCVDNLPMALIPTFAELTLGRGDRRRAAVVIDIREERAPAQFPAIYRRLKRRLEQRIRLVFLEASHASLVRRFSETRRPHPLGTGRTLPEAIDAERRQMQPIRRLADHILDTTTLTVHQLRAQILQSAGGKRQSSPLGITVMSFAYRHGVPAEADLVFDVRFLPNPHFVTALRRWTGRSARVSQYVLDAPAAARFLDLTGRLLKFLIPQFIAEGKSYLTIAIGCTGGRHRSVAIAEALGRALSPTKGARVRVAHRDVAAS